MFHCPSPDPNKVQIIGCVSAYHANRATGEALPGLLRAQDVSHFHGVADYIRNLDEANVKKREFEEAQKQKAIAEKEGVQQSTPSEGTIVSPAEPAKPEIPQAQTEDQSR